MLLRKNIYFSLVAVFLVFSFLESVVRVVYFVKYKNVSLLLAPFGAPPPEIKKVPRNRYTSVTRYKGYHKLTPGKYFREEQQDGEKHAYFITINSTGFRNREIKLQKQAYRVIAFGESSTEGVESPDDQTWPAHLEKLLQKKKKVEVINMGLSANRAENTFNLLTQEAYAYKPDLVLLYLGRNDVYHNHGMLSVLDTWYEKMLFFIHSHILYYKSMLYTYLLEKVSVYKSGHPDPLFFSPFNPYDALLDHLRKILEFCSKNNIKVAYICQVNHSGNVQKNIELMAAVHQNIDYLGDKNSRDERYHISVLKMQSHIHRFLEKEYPHVQFIDPKRAFYQQMLLEKRHLFSEDNTSTIHLTPLGNLLLARLVAQELHF